MHVIVNRIVVDDVSAGIVVVVIVVVDNILASFSLRLLTF